jgi:hypothetical protein
MIPLPSGLMLKAIIGVVVFASGAAVGWGTRGTIAERDIAKLERGYADERTKASQATAEKSEEWRKVEAAYRRRLAQQEREFNDTLADRDDRNRRLAASNSVLSKHWDAIAKYSGPTGDTTRPCGYVQDRLAGAGVLLGEIDSLAEESARFADDVRDEIKLCRGYADSIQQVRQ